MAGRSSSIDVFLRLHGQRKFSKEVAASGAELEALGLKGAKAMSAFAAKADSLKKFGKSWTRHVSLPVAALGVVAGGMAMNFKRQMGLVATDAGGTMKEVEALEGSVLGLARESQYSPQQLAESLFHVESAGYRGAKAMKVLRESSRLATSGNSELEQTTYALVSANKALNEGDSLNGITKTAAQLNEIVAHGDIRLEELTAAMSTGLLPTAKALGLNVADVGSALDIMTARGIPAQRSAYALNFTLQKLVPSTEKAQDVFKELGIGQEQLIRLAQKKGLPWALDLLKQKLANLPKGRQIQKIDEMFGGGRMSKGLLVVLQHIDEAKKKWHEVDGDVRLYNKHVHEAEEQPLVKLKKAWSGIQASLVEIGDELLPIAGPGLEMLAKSGEKLATAFMALPGPVKAAAVGFLLLTGPVASGLGYFASGIGRTLILTTKLAAVAKNFSIFKTALQSGQGFKGSAGVAFEGFGKSGAVQAAKGFAYSLGPAVAAYGIANIVTSATSGDWGDAGYEAGGAMAGGIAGFLLGGPMGAMLGVGLGSLGGELLSGLFSGGKDVPRLQERIAASSKGIKAALEGERSAVQSFDASQKGLVRARHKQRTAAEQLKGTEHALSAARASAPAGSMAIARAEVHVARAVERVTRAKRAAKRAERLKGEDRAILKEQLRYAALEERHRKKLLKQEVSGLRAERHTLKARHASLGELKPVNEALIKSTGKLRGVNKQANDTFAEASSKVGPRFAGFLRHASREALDLGSSFKAVRHEVKLMTRSIEQLGRAAEEAEPFEAGILQGKRNTLQQQLPGARRHLEHLESHGGRKHSPAKSRPRVNTGYRNSAPRRVALRGDGLANVLKIELHSHSTIELDGKVAAESTARQSQKAANRE